MNELNKEGEVWEALREVIAIKAAEQGQPRVFYEVLNYVERQLVSSREHGILALLNLSLKKDQKNKKQIIQKY